MRGELDWIVMKCLEKDRARRYETANGLAADVQRYLADEPVTAGPPSAAYRLRKFARRNKGVLAAAAGWFSPSWSPPRRSAPGRRCGPLTPKVSLARTSFVARRAETRAEEEAERARQLAAETEVQRRQVELHLRIALLLTDREPSLLTIREELDKRELAPEALLRIAKIVLKHTPEKEEAWKLLSRRTRRPVAHGCAGSLREGGSWCAELGPGSQPPGLVPGHQPATGDSNPAGRPPCRAGG